MLGVSQAPKADGEGFPVELDEVKSRITDTTGYIPNEDFCGVLPT